MVIHADLRSNRFLSIVRYSILRIKLAEGWGREEWRIGKWIFLVSKNLGDAGHQFLA